MNILFLTLSTIDSLNNTGIYTDLLREFRDNDNYIYVITPLERRNHKDTYIVSEKNTTIVHLKVGNLFKTNIIEKGLSTVFLEQQYKTAIDKHFRHIKFDLVLYSTPPITLVSAIEYVKKRDGAKTYLLLKDIFPQNAVDIGLMSTTGMKGLLYRYFRRQEKRLYTVSDWIGCMSQANVDYVIKHNPEVDPAKVEVCPNCVEVVDKSVDDVTKKQIREKYGIPHEKRVFVYGGNLGKPQGIPFLIECLKKCQDIEDAFFLIVGDGTEYGVLESYVEQDKPANVKLMKRLPKEDYDTMVGACDVGLIFLDHRFTIPNFPSRLLSYMEGKMPVLAATDTSTDIGQVVEAGKFGYWCESNDVQAFVDLMDRFSDKSERELMGSNAFIYLKAHYDVAQAYETIIAHIDFRGGRNCENTNS